MNPSIYSIIFNILICRFRSSKDTFTERAKEPKRTRRKQLLVFLFNQFTIRSLLLCAHQARNAIHCKVYTLQKVYFCLFFFHIHRRYHQMENRKYSSHLPCSIFTIYSKKHLRKLYSWFIDL